MIVEKIKLINFRNYKELILSLSNGLNVFYGNNASGKTNIVEAINYLSIGRSFRTHNDTDLIKLNEKSAYVSALIDDVTFKQELSFTINKEGKKITINNKPLKKLSDISEIINVIYFIPENVLLLKGSPKERRDFLNLSLSKEFKDYLFLISSYNKILKERNDALKEEEIDLKLIDVLTESLIKYSEKIYSYRKDYIARINRYLTKIYQKISLNLNDEITMHYVPFVSSSDYVEKARDEYRKFLSIDIKRKTTSIGIHLEDFFIVKNNKNVGLFGSQGENRLVVLALKLSPYFLIENENKKPIVILDDVLSELDANNQLNFINLLKDFKQVFITSTSKLDIVGINNYFVNNGSVIKEE